MDTFYYYTDLISAHLQSIDLASAVEIFADKRAKYAIWCAQNFTDTPIPVIESLNTPVYEFVRKEQILTRTYLDLDIPADFFSEDVTPRNFVHALPTILQSALSIAEFEICDIYSSQTNNATLDITCGKLSLHILIDRSITRADGQLAAKIVGCAIKRFYPHFQEKFVDTTVYGISQKFRAPFTSKRGVKRFKVPIELGLIRQGDIKLSLLTVVPEKPLFNKPTVQETRDPEYSMSAKLKWFESALNQRALKQFWAEKANDYTTWGTIGQSCYIEGKHSGCLKEAADLFVRFSLLAASPDSSDHLILEFYRKWVSSKNDLFNEVKKWVKEENPVLYKELGKTAKKNPINTGAPLQYPTFDDLPPTDLYHDELFDYMTREQFILGEHILRSPSLRAYWKELLSKGDHYPLVGLAPNFRLAYYKKCEENVYKSFGFAFPKSKLPFPDVYDNSQQFYKWFCENLGLTFNPPTVEANEMISKDGLACYLNTAQSIDLTTVDNIRELSDSYVEPFGELEERDYAGQIWKIAFNRTGLRWKTQYPYYFYLRGLLDKTAEKDGIFEQNRFWLVLSKVSESDLQADRIFHLLSFSSTPGVAARIVMNLYPFFRLSVDREIYVYDDVEGFWSKSEKVKASIITKFSAFLEHPNGNLAYQESVRKQILKFIETSSEIRERGPGDFQRQMTTSKMKLLFNNGYLNAETNVFSPKESIELNGRNLTFFNHPNIMFFGKIDNTYATLGLNDQADYEDMKHVYFMGMHGDEVGSYWRRYLGLILMGITCKSFFEHIGDPSSGKSTELAMLRSSFNSYVSEGQTSWYENRKFDSRPEERQIQFLVDTWFTRLQLISEQTDFEGRINSNRLKKFSSGGLDKPRASKLYENGADFDVFFIISWYVNKALQFDDPSDKGIFERRNSITWQKVYVDEVVDSSTQLLRRPEITTWHFDKRRQLIYNHLIIDGFKEAVYAGYKLERPLSLMPIITDDNQYSVTTEDVIEQISQFVCITGNPKHVISSADLSDIIANRLKFIVNKTIPAMKDYLGRLGVSVTSSQLRRQGKKIQVWKGLEMRNNLMVTDLTKFADFEHWKKLMIEHNGCLTDEAYDAVCYVESICLGTNFGGDYNVEKVEKFASPAQKNYIEKNRSKRHRPNEFGEFTH